MSGPAQSQKVKEPRTAVSGRCLKLVNEVFRQVGNGVYSILLNMNFNTKNACLRDCLNLGQKHVNQLCKIGQPRYSPVFLCLNKSKGLFISQASLCSSQPSFFLFCQAGAVIKDVNQMLMRLKEFYKCHLCLAILLCSQLFG